MAKLSARQKEIRAKAVEAISSADADGGESIRILLGRESKWEKAAAITPKMIGDYTEHLVDARKIRTLYHLRNVIGNVPAHVSAYKKALKGMELFQGYGSHIRFNCEVIVAFDTAAKGKDMPITCEYSFPPHHKKQGSPKDIYNWLNGSEVFTSYYPSAPYEFKRLFTRVAAEEGSTPIGDACRKVVDKLELIAV